MPDITEVYAPFNNVNDESITIVELCAEEGSFVETDTVLLAVETSKAVLEIHAPTSGYVRFLVKLNEDVSIGNPLCVIAADQESLARYSPQGGRTFQSGGGVEAVSIPQQNLTPFGVARISVAAGQVEGKNVTLCHWLVPDESPVTVGQDLCRVMPEVNTLIKLTSPVSGFVKFCGEPGDIFPVADPICLVGDTLKLVRSYTSLHRMRSELESQDIKWHCAPQYDPGQYTKTPPSNRTGPSRFSRKARELMARYSLEEDAFPSQGLVRADDVLAHLGVLCTSDEAPFPQPPSRPLLTALPGGLTDDMNVVDAVPYHEEKLSRAKRTEVQLLTSAQASAVTSQVSLLVPTRGVFSACLKHANFTGQISSRIIFEISRLLKKYPALNAGYRSGHIVYYDEVNIGYALDINQGIKVPVFHAADTLSLEEITRRKQTYLEKYLLKKLGIDDMSRGTFTITDLSEQGTWLFNPIINKGQAAILGIGGEQLMGPEQFYPLVLAYDHRLAEGLLATKFLADLKDRLLAHESILLKQMGILSRVQDENVEEPYCHSCLRKASDINAQQNYLFNCIGANGKERLICSVCAGGW